MENLDKAQHATITHVKGEVKVDSLQGQMLQTGDIVAPLSQVYLASGAELTLLLADGKEYKITEDNLASIDALNIAFVSEANNAQAENSLLEQIDEIERQQEVGGNDDNIDDIDTEAFDTSGTIEFSVLERSANELLAQAGYDTSGLSNDNLAPENPETTGDLFQTSPTENTRTDPNLIDDDEVVFLPEDTSITGNVLENAESINPPFTLTDFSIAGTTYAIGTVVTLDEGTFTLTAEGNYTFTPNENFNGDVPVVNYTVRDAANDTDDSTLTIIVTPEPDITDGDEVMTTPEDTPISGNVLNNASSPDAPITVTTFTVAGITYEAGAIADLDEGTFTLSADGIYTFTPNENFNGDVPVVNYTVRDAANDTDDSTLTITVTPEPDITDGDEVVTTPEDTPVSGNVLNNASSPDAPIIVTSFVIEDITYDAGSTVILEEGVFTLNGDGSYNFTPFDNFNGDVPVVNYTVRDAANDTDESTLNITVTPESDITDGNEVVTTPEDTPVSGNVLNNASSPDAPITVITFTVAGIVYEAGATADLDEGIFTLNDDGSYTFTPNENFNGDVPVVNYTVRDAANDTDESTLNISVTPESDITDGNEVVTTPEDTPVSGNVLSNALSPDDPIIVTSFTIAGIAYDAGSTVIMEEGVFTLNGDGSYSFIPFDNFNGDVPVVNYTVRDAANDTDESTLTITVTPNADITDGNEAVTTAEDTPVSGNVLENASSPDAPLTVLTFTIAGTPYDAGAVVDLDEGTFTLGADGNYTFTPSENFNGDVPVVSYTVQDGAGDTDESSLTINVTPELPIAVDDNFWISVQGDDFIAGGNVITQTNANGESDNEGGDNANLSVTAINGVELTFAADGYATVNLGNGTLRINAAGDFTLSTQDTSLLGSGVSAFEYTITDGYDIATANVTIDSVPDAVNDNNRVTYELLPGSDIVKTKPVGGNVIGRGASSDRPDSSPDGQITLVKFNYLGQDYIFDGNSTSHQIQTEWGVLTVQEDGVYEFRPNEEMKVADLVSEINFGYTIQDGDTVNPETDSATLQISFVEKTSSSNGAPLLDTSELLAIPEVDQISADLGAKDSSLSPHDIEFADILLSSTELEFDDNQLINALIESEEGITHEPLGLQIEQTGISPESADASLHESKVVNDMLATGVTLQGDNSVETTIAQPEMDTSDSY